LPKIVANLDYNVTTTVTGEMQIIKYNLRLETKDQLHPRFLTWGKDLNCSGIISNYFIRNTVEYFPYHESQKKRLSGISDRRIEYIKKTTI